MWVAEIVAEVRGENLSLANNSTSGWIFDAHAKVKLALYLSLTIFVTDKVRQAFK